MGVIMNTNTATTKEQLIAEVRRYRTAYIDASKRADVASIVIQQQREELSFLRAELSALRGEGSAKLVIFPLHFPFQFIVGDVLFLFKCEGDTVESHSNASILIQHTYTLEESLFATQGFPERRVCTIIASLMQGMSEGAATEFLLSVFSTWEQL